LKEAEDMAMTRKTLALATTAWLVIAVIGLGQVPARKDGLAPGELRKAVAKAHEIRARIAKLEDQNAKSAAEEEFRKVVVGCRESFPEVAAVPGGRARYTKLNLNSRGGGFDAFRFLVPSAGRSYQLYLSFAYPGTSKTHNIAALNIVEINGEDLILTRPEVQENVTIAGMNLPEPNWWSQYRLYGRKLQAGREYLFYFDLKSDEPFPILVRVRIEPLETAEPPHTPALQTARGTFQAALEKLNERYDNDAKALRGKYLTELDRASKALTKKNVATQRPVLVAEADRANLGDSEAGDPRGFRIIRAEIGVGDQWNDVTVPAQSLVRENRLKVDSPEYDFQPDSAFGVKKSLIIVYTIDGRPGVYAAPADRKVDLPPSPAATTPAKK
jgi:hypothetical protein